MTPTLTALDYRCKICGKPGVAHYDTNCPVHRLESWRSALCCDRCGRFRDGYLRTKERATHACILLQQARATCFGKVLAEAESRLEARLTTATQRAARLVCDHYRVTTTWSEDFVSTLMDKPGGVERVFHAYHAGIISRQTPAAVPMPTQPEMIPA